MASDDGARAKVEDADDAALARTIASGDIPRTNAPGVATDLRSPDPAFAATMTPEVASARVSAGTSTLTTEHPGRYVRQDEIGRGGMGRVVSVKDTHLGREVALKELLDQSGPGNDAMSIGSAARFLREARITGQLEHPGIVPVHELGQRADGTIYYTMKRIRGRSLASVLKEKTTLAERLTLLSVFRNVCEAVAYAHSRGIVHRDLKPDNVMVGEFGDTLVVDWGLAKVRGEVESGRFVKKSGAARIEASDDAARTLDGHAIGTPAYMSPEQARGELGSIDERADVWGLGTILFEILAGRPPYAGTSALGVLAKVLDDPPPRVREVAPDAPAELAAVVDRALMRDPSSRYPNAGELSKEIGAYLDGRTVGAYEYSAYELVLRFVRRHRAASLAVASVALAVITASIVVYRSFLHEGRARAMAEAARDDAMEQRSAAMDSMHAAEGAVADALLERAERALSEGDASGAAVYAAGALVHEVAAESMADPHRHVRALSVYAQADTERRYVFERTVPSVSARASLSTDGRTLVVPTEDDVRVIRLDDASERRISIHATQVRRAGNGIAVVESAAPGLYDLESGVLVAASPAPTGVAMSAGGVAVSSADGSVVVWSADGRSEIARLATARRGQVRVALSPDGLTLAVIAADVPQVDLWSLAGPAPVGPTSVTLPAIPFVVAFGPHSSEMAVLASDGVNLVSTQRGAPSAREIATDSWPTGLLWSDDGTLALYEWPDRITIREAESGAVLDVLHMPTATGGHIAGGGSRIAFLPNDIHSSGLLASTVFVRAAGAGRDEAMFATGVRMVMSDMARRRVVATTLSEVWSIAVLSNGTLGPRTRLFVLPDGVGIVHLACVTSDGSVVVQTPRGALLVARSPDYVPELVRSPIDATETISLAGLAVAPDGSEVFTGSGTSGTVLRWSIVEHREQTPLEGQHGVVRAIAASSDGTHIATGARDGTVRIWNVRTDTVEHEVAGHDVAVAALAFSPTGDRLAMADENGQLQLFDTRAASVIATGRLHERWVNGLAWSSDGRWIVTASDDLSAAVVSSENLEPVRIVRTRTAPVTATLESDGNHLLVPDGRAVHRIDLRMALDEPTPATLLDQAEQRAGVRLDGFTLGPRSP